MTDHVELPPTEPATGPPRPTTAEEHAALLDTLDAAARALPRRTHPAKHPAGLPRRLAGVEQVLRAPRRAPEHRAGGLMVAFVDYLIRQQAAPSTIDGCPGSR